MQEDVHLSSSNTILDLGEVPLYIHIPTKLKKKKKKKLSDNCYIDFKIICLRDMSAELTFNYSYNNYMLCKIKL